MSRLSSLLSAASMSVVLGAPVLADVTAEDVWNDWQSYVGSLGYQIEGTPERDGDTLVVNGMVLRSDNGRDAGSARIDVGRVTFAERSDGSVAVSLPAVMPAQISTPNDTGGTTDVGLTYSQSGLMIDVSGTPVDMLYAYRADEVALAMTALTINGKPLPEDENAFSAAFENLSGTMSMSMESLRNYVQAFAIDRMRIDGRMKAEATDNTVTLSGETRDMRFDGTSAMPLAVAQADNMGAMLRAGFAASGTFSYGANTFDIVATSSGGPQTLSLQSDSGTLGVTMGEAGLTYRVTQEDTRATVQAADIPVPINLEVARSAFNLTMPIQKSETQEDFALGFTLDGVSVSEILWGLFDPAGQLPRDPAVVAVDLAGKARLLFDFLDPSAASMSGSPDVTPAEIESVDINRLQISAAGAELTGKGGFVFDNSAGGAPKPEGGVDLTLVGGNGLLDKLVAIGLLPEQQAMGARMMMGLLAVPGGAPDTLNSRIEINDKGHISANGQRIQ